MATTVMNDMVQQLYGTSVFATPQTFNSRFSVEPARFSFYEEPRQPLTFSALCQVCQVLFDGRKLAPTPGASSYQGDSAGSSVRRSDERPHHGIDELARQASAGCHLCLTVYQAINPETLQDFRKSLMISDCSRESTSRTSGVSKSPTCNKRIHALRSLGFASVTPIGRDQAKLCFRFVKDVNAEASLSSQNEYPMRKDSVASPENLNSSLLATGPSPCVHERGLRSEFPTSSSSERSSASTSNGPKHRTESRSSGSREGLNGALAIELILLNPSYAVEPGVHFIPKESASTGSKETLAIAKQWVEDCSFNHMKCSISDSGVTWKPTHLLDVSVKGPNGAPGIRLVDGIFVDPLAEYVTLSHCWGPKKATRLHKGTLATLRQGVARSNIPKTFADAARVVEELGFRYLWIDALCIMHDSETAVLKEISSMRSIYSEAILNIAASGSADDHMGMFYTRNVEALHPCVVEVQGYGIDKGPYKILRSTVWKDLVDDSPLSKRAWAFQERALAKRTLHFTRTEVLWECQQICCSEVYPKGLPVTGATLAAQESSNGGWGCSMPSGESFNKRTHHTRTGNWGQLVRTYSAGHLTYKSDKLLAIGGLARQYMSKNRMQESDYIAGLWRPQMPFCLLWRVDRGRRPSRYRAPTWTWTSIDGTIEYFDGPQNGRQNTLEVVDCATTTRGADPFGMCQSGWLKVRGFLARGLLRRNLEYWGTTSCSVRFLEAEVVFEDASFDDRLPKISDGDGIMTETLEVYMLPVIDVVERVGGLILNATSKKGEFKRIGTFEISLRDQGNWERFKSVMKGDPDMTNYEERLDHKNGYWFASDYTYTLTLL